MWIEMSVKFRFLHFGFQNGVWLKTYLCLFIQLVRDFISDLVGVSSPILFPWTSRRTCSLLVSISIGIRYPYLSIALFLSQIFCSVHLDSVQIFYILTKNYFLSPSVYFSQRVALVKALKMFTLFCLVHFSVCVYLSEGTDCYCPKPAIPS